MYRGTFRGDSNTGMVVILRFIVIKSASTQILGNLKSLKT